eukprot:m51a1_g12314 hypothetical protein (273) ;mRNA; r:406426-407532
MASSDSESSDGLEGAGLFEGEQSFFKPEPQPHEHTYARAHASGHADPPSVVLRVVGSHPLWAHHLWNAAIVLADWIDEGSAGIQGTSLDRVCSAFQRVTDRRKRVVEFGSGAALPTIMCALCGAASVTATDYPDAPLLDNIRVNVDRNVAIAGHIWGTEDDGAFEPGTADVVVLSDILATHAAHGALAKSCVRALRRGSGSRVLLAYSHHRPWLADKDLKFFDEAAAAGLTRPVELFTRQMPPMFPGDPGPEDVRSTVHVVEMRLADEAART